MAKKPERESEAVEPVQATCPACLASLDVPAMTTLKGLAPCPSCARTLVVTDGAVRLATAEDVLPLSETERNQIKALRPKAWRDDVKARSMAIRGKRR